MIKTVRTFYLKQQNIRTVYFQQETRIRIPSRISSSLRLAYPRTIVAGLWLCSGWIK